MTSESDGVRAVARALDILKAFRPDEGELLVADLVGRVGLSRTTLYRLVYTLIDEGFLVSVGDPQRIRLGPAVGTLAHVWATTLDLPRLIDPVMRDLWRETGETVALWVREGTDRRCVAEMPSTQALSFRRGVGHRERIILGASGRAILASSDPSSGDIEHCAMGSKVDLAKYRSDLAEVRRRGYAVSHEELIAGAISIAAPVFTAPGQVAGSIAVFGPSVRLREAEIRTIASLLLRETKRASELLFDGGATTTHRPKD